MATVALLALTGVGCGGDEEGAPGVPATIDALEGYPECDETVGQVLTEEEWSRGCRTGNRLEAAGSVECEDGRTIWWHAGGWAYLGESAQPTEGGAVPGDVYWSECQGIER